jgi:hypothetical protein
MAVRYQRERPGELIHVDVKKLGRIPQGGGWRLRGRTLETGHQKHLPKRGHDYLHVAVDDATRVAFIEVFPDDRAASCAAFLEHVHHFLTRHGCRYD